MRRREIAPGVASIAVLCFAPAFAQLAGGSPETPPDTDNPPSGYIDYAYAANCSGHLAALAEIVEPSHEMHGTFVAFADAYKRWGQTLADTGNIARARLAADIEKRRAERVADYEKARRRSEEAERAEEYRVGACACILFGSGRIR